jgi:hypothetical protein
LSSTTITIELGLAQPGRRTGVYDVEILIVGTIEIDPERRTALLEAVRPYAARGGRLA